MEFQLFVRHSIDIEQMFQTEQEAWVWVSGFGEKII